MSDIPHDPAALRAEILQLTRAYSRLAHGHNRPGYALDPLRPPFTAGASSVPYAGRVFTEDEVEAAVAATLDFWLTLGKEGEAFEKQLAEFLGVKSSVLVNSGSSANLLAVSALSSPRLGNRRVRPGDEIITVAAGFPTTVAPIIQNGFVPVFIDNDPVTLNAKVEELEDAYAEGKTKAVFFAHTLGNPFDLGAVTDFCRRHDLWLIEDNCDSLGSSYSLPVDQAREFGLEHLLKTAASGIHPLIRFETVAAPHLPSSLCQLLTAPTGTFGEFSTQSFYPPHHLTLGEGGAVNVASLKLRTVIESFRDWGRDCWCASGKDNTCGKRFDWQLGQLPNGYDHKFTYSHLGYNLKPLDIQAAIGLEQLKKLPRFIQARIDNWNYLRAGLADLGEFFDFMLPTHATAWTPVVSSSVVSGPLPPLPSPISEFTWDSTDHRVVASWFGFMLRVKPGSPFSKFQLARHLDEKKIGNRMLFGGNLVRQPVLVQLAKDRPGAFRVVGDLPGADAIMNQALFIAAYPGLTPEMLDYMIETVTQFVRSK
jgi:CDP-6-deoxy-D-xylo-4-hexulose-3-dehydrase